MAEHSGFFDAELVNNEYDRVYLAESFAKYFASFIGNGVFGGKSDELIVKQQATANMSVRVMPGLGWINGYWYENDEELSLQVEIADGVLHRIDSIVLRWSSYDRVIRAHIKKGVASANPVAPTNQRDAYIYEIKLANIYVAAGTTSIQQQDISDVRFDTELCGFVQGVVQQFDTTEFGIQLNSFIEAFRESNTAKAQQIFNELEGLISQDVAASLVYDVNNLKKIAIEDDTETGCFYRINPETSVKEWINPPSRPGIEYCTTERWNNKPVYQTTFYAASLPNNSYMTISIAANYTNVISITGFAVNSDENLYCPFPIIMSSIAPIAAICEFMGNGGTGGDIIIKTTADISSYKAYITIKYTKG